MAIASIPRACQAFDSADALVAAHVVEHQRGAADLVVAAGQQLRGRHHMVLVHAARMAIGHRRLDPVHARRRAGREDYCVWLVIVEIGLVDPGVEQHTHAAPVHFILEPVDHVADTGMLGRQPRHLNRAAQPGSRLRQGDAVAPQRRHPRRLHAGRAAAHHQHVLRRRRGRQILAEGQLAARDHVHRAGDASRHQPAEATLVAADARPDLVAAPLQRLADDVRVGDVGAGHADHVGVAAGDGVVHILQRSEPAGDEARDAVLGHPRHRHAHVQFVAGVLMHGADDLGAGRPRGAVGDVEEIYQVLLQHPRNDLLVFLDIEPARRVVRPDPQAKGVFRADHGPHGAQRLHQQPHAVLEAAAILVGTVVELLGNELLEQEVVGRMHLDAVEPALDRATRRLGEGVDDLGDLVLRHGVRGHAGQRVDQDFRCRPGLRPGRPLQVTHMVDLREHPHAVRLHRLHQFLIARDDVVAPGVHGHGTGPVHAGGFGQRQADAALGPGFMVGDQIVGQIGAEVRAVRRAQHPVLDFQPVDHERTEHVFQRHPDSPASLPAAIMVCGTRSVKRDFSAATRVKKTKALSLDPDMPHMWRCAGRRAGHRA